MGSVKFVLNHKGVREELLLANGEVKVEEMLVAAATAAAPAGSTVEVSRSYSAAGRVRVRIIDSSGDDDRTVNARLQTALNSVRP